jgi:hypothetical protein
MTAVVFVSKKNEKAELKHQPFIESKIIKLHSKAIILILRSANLKIIWIFARTLDATLRHIATI